MKFSIIIPIYNVASYIQEALYTLYTAAKIARKNHQDFLLELLCIDDGSSDNSVDVLNRFNFSVKASWFSVKVFRQKNMGVSVARNLGLTNATGDWIGFLDADDVIHPQTFDYYYRLIESDKSSDIVGAKGATFLDGEEYPWKNKNINFIDEPNKYNLIQGIRQDLVSRGFALYLYRNTLLHDIEFARFKYGEDRLFLVECMSEAKMVVYGNACIYGYRIREGSACSHSKNCQITDSLFVIPRMFQSILGAGRTADEAFVRSYCNVFLEEIPSVGLDNELIPVWFNSLKQLRPLIKRYRFQWFRLLIFQRIRLWFIVRMIGMLVYKLKMMGVHR